MTEQHQQQEEDTFIACLRSTQNKINTPHLFRYPPRIPAEPVPFLGSIGERRHPRRPISAVQKNRYIPYVKARNLDVAFANNRPLVFLHAADGGICQFQAKHVHKVRQNAQRGPAHPVLGNRLLHFPIHGIEAKKLERRALFKIFHRHIRHRAVKHKGIKGGQNATRCHIAFLFAQIKRYLYDGRQTVVQRVLKRRVRTLTPLLLQRRSLAFL